MKQTMGLGLEKGEPLIFDGVPLVVKCRLDDNRLVCSCGQYSITIWEDDVEWNGENYVYTRNSSNEFLEDMIEFDERNKE